MDNPSTALSEGDDYVFASSEEVWRRCVESGDVDAWIEHLDRLEISDHLSFVARRGATKLNEQVAPLDLWMEEVARRGTSAFYRDDSASTPIDEQLALATYDRWVTRLERLLNTPEIRDERLPRHGVLQYFADHLSVCVLIGYRVIGSAVELLNIFPVREPTSYADPVRALRFARTDTQLDLLRRSLYNRHKVVVQRNTLVHVDREDDVFGPSIDTLLLNDWLFENRYLPQRSVDNSVYFEELLPKGVSRETKENGTRFLEIGCGNGLLTATFARNEVKVRTFTAIDVAADAVATTHKNSARQRLIHRGTIGDRGIYQIATYDRESVHGDFDLVVCNPPYIPLPPEFESRHPLTGATMGTKLLEQVIGDADHLLAEKGQMAIVASVMAEPELRTALPAGFVANEVGWLRVPFQVEAILSTDTRGYVDWLERERGLMRTGGDVGIVGHEHVVAIWIVERGEAAQ